MLIIPNKKKLINALNNMADDKQITINHNNQIKQELECYREISINLNKGRIGVIEKQLPVSIRMNKVK